MKRSYNYLSRPNTMKKILYLYIAWSIITGFVSCKKDDMPIYDAGAMKHGSISACRNGDDWLASGSASFYANDNGLVIIRGDMYDIGGVGSNKTETFSISKVPLQKGKYQLSNGNLSEMKPEASISFLDYDALFYTYTLDEDKVSWVALTEIDTLNNHLKGCFEIYLTQISSSYENAPDKLCFKKGEFSVDIME
jgi:hypothetical protein